MKKLSQTETFDALYGLAADDGREETLFGSCVPLAREAFQRSLVGEEFPVVWFELPLSGKPRFDLHVALSRETLRAGCRFLPGAGNGYDELFRWYSEGETGGCGLAFAYDVSEGLVDDPAVHANVNNAPLSNVDRFFDLAAGDGTSELYHGLVSRIPQGWKVWYIGVHPGRPGSPVRVDCFVSAALQRAYAADASLLERDLKACGFRTLGPALYDLATPILQSPFGLELQFDVMRDGGLGTTLGLSAGFSKCSKSAVRRLFEDGAAGATLMGAIEDLGLSDGRWRHIPDAAFSKLVRLGAENLALYCTPTFVKLRMRDGAPLDAKAYLEASAAALG